MMHRIEAQRANSIRAWPESSRARILIRPGFGRDRVNMIGSSVAIAWREGLIAKRRRDRGGVRAVRKVLPDECGHQRQIGGQRDGDGIARTSGVVAASQYTGYLDVGNVESHRVLL